MKEVEGLADEVVGARGEAVPRDLALGRDRHDDDGHVAVGDAGPHLAAQLESALVGQQQIQTAGAPAAMPARQPRGAMSKK